MESICIFEGDISHWDERIFRLMIFHHCILVARLTILRKSGNKTQKSKKGKGKGHPTGVVGKENAGHGNQTRGYRVF